MIRVFAPQMLLYGVGAVLSGLLQAAGRFGWPAFAPVLSSVVVMASYLLYGAVVGDRAGAITGAALPGSAFAALAWGTTAGVAAMTLPLLIPVARNGFRLRPRTAFPPGTARRAAALTASGVLAVLAQQAFLLTTIVLANHFGSTGTQATFGYAQAIWVLPYAVLVAPLITALFPRLAMARGEAFAELTARSLRTVLVAGAAGSALLAAAAPGVAGLFEAIDRGSVGAMGTALVIAAPSVLGFALVSVAGRVLYAVHAARAAAVGTSAGWLTAIVAATLAVLVLPADRALVGLTAGYSVGMAVGAVVLLLVTRRRRGSAALAGVRVAATGLLPAAAVAGVAGWALDRVLVTSLGGGAVAAVLAAAVAVLVAALVFAVAALPAVALAESAGTAPEPPLEPDSVLLVLGTSAGGIGRHVAALATGLAVAGVRVAVAAPAPTLAGMAREPAGSGESGGSGEDGGLDRRVATRVLAVGERPDVQDPATVRRLRTLARGAAVVHAHGIRAGAFAVLACSIGGRRPPVVVTVHNAPPTGGGPSGLIYRGLERLTARRADVVLAVSQDLRARLQRERRPGAVPVERALVPSPGRAVPPSERPAVRRRLRAELAVPEGVCLVVTVARLAPQKGLAVLLEAVAALERPVRVAIAGDGPLHGELAAAVRDRGLPVALLGRRPDAPDLLAAADLVVVPSLWEGQPLIVQEALAAGAAIVATDAGGTAEVLGGAGVLVPPGDAAALAAAITGLVADDPVREEWARAALRRSGELPSDTQAVTQVMTAYRRVAADRLESRGAAHT
jgi:putative peptidoglycan lipid II flippase